jgi:Right handed beta helix region
MRKAFLSLALAVSAFGVTLASGPAAQAATIDVFPGDSIQAAVNHASPGDLIVVHPGTYSESVLIKKNFLTLRGSGSSATGTVLVPPTEETTRCLHGGAGFCVFGHRDENGQPIAVRGTTITGFLVNGFPAFGGVAFGAKNTTFAHDVFTGNGEYGVTAFGSQGTRFLYNESSGSGVAGFYLGDSPFATALAQGNRSHDNGFTGFLIRDASHGVITNNRLYGNCSGMAFLNTGAPGGVHGWSATENQVYQNNRACPAQEGPPASGVGIALLGARNILVRHNTVWGNHPTGETAWSGGIVLADSKQDGGTVEAGNTIIENQAYHNQSADISWDGKGRNNDFIRNKCGTSNPDGLCH